MVLLIGNYEPDRQQSMQRFGTMMVDGLRAAGVAAEMIKPEPYFGRFRAAGATAVKWLGYVDKFLIFPFKLKRKLAERPAVVHICDHSNAVYTARIRETPVVVTCHDLLAVRGGLGEQTDTPASSTGRVLQRWILRGLRRATSVACSSRATLSDAQRLVVQESAGPQLSVIMLGLSYPYRRIPGEESIARLQSFAQLAAGNEFIMHVGSNARRKNREAVLRIFARARQDWNGRLVFAGDALNGELRALAHELGVARDVIEIAGPPNELLEALYNRTVALVYPSRFEGFGWPIAEAHACGCPVICSDREPLPEVAGDASLTHDVEDVEGFAADVLHLTNAQERARWSEKSLRNAERFTSRRMIEQYIALYRSVGVQL